MRQHLKIMDPRDLACSTSTQMVLQPMRLCTPGTRCAQVPLLSYSQDTGLALTGLTLQILRLYLRAWSWAILLVCQTFSFLVAWDLTKIFQHHGLGTRTTWAGIPMVASGTLEFGRERNNE